jgi:hypothetical protein
MSAATKKSSPQGKIRLGTTHQVLSSSIGLDLSEETLTKHGQAIKSSITPEGSVMNLQGKLLPTTKTNRSVCFLAKLGKQKLCAPLGTTKTIFGLLW